MTERNIYQRLAAARDKIGLVVAKDEKATVPTKGGKPYSYTYASLQRVLEVVTGPLRGEGIEIVATPLRDVLVVELVMVDDPEQRIHSEWDIPAGPAQSRGSEITYGRRYLTQTMAGVATEDDDGARASKPRQPAKDHRAGVVEVLQKRLAKDLGIPERDAFDQAEAELAETLVVLGIEPVEEAEWVEAARWVIAYHEAVLAAPGTGEPTPELKDWLAARLKAEAPF